MDLKDFVKNTLVEIASGVKEAQKATKELGVVINPVIQTDYSNDLNVSYHTHKVEFNVALTVADESKIGCGIQIATMFKAGGDIKEANRSVSIISFRVPIMLPFTK